MKLASKWCCPNRELLVVGMDRSKEVSQGFHSADATMTATDVSNVVSPRATSRSPRIPFPSDYVARTQSEIELSIDKEKSKQHELKMFHRLVNGIRDHQKKLGMVTDLPPNFMENIPDAVRNFHIALAGGEPPFSQIPHSATIKKPPHTNWLQPTTTTPPIPTVQDDWSISGFESLGDDGFTASDASAVSGFVRPLDREVVAAPSPGRRAYEDQADQQQEEIFQLDF
jgi:hypothetical protein